MRHRIPTRPFAIGLRYSPISPLQLGHNVIDAVTASPLTLGATLRRSPGEDRNVAGARATI